ncbi:unnamed protein product [Caenorhabditis auriculariae]|uniref:Uncharacterized protein n=1 Tax=Caenorhabditis auriculariae TaxID=2777116 RepID=A0A8S1HRH5_9PELO|nr:unnamed protein product [Caenorhabditis auriculariae]
MNLLFGNSANPKTTSKLRNEAKKDDFEKVANEEGPARRVELSAMPYSGVIQMSDSLLTAPSCELFCLCPFVFILRSVCPCMVMIVSGAFLSDGSIT